MARGNSGGLLNIWHSSMMTGLFSFAGDGFSGVCFERGVGRIQCFIVNVYSPCNLAGKRRLWEDLKSAKSRLEYGLWCIVGDFNAVCNSRERKGVGLYLGSQEVSELRRFVEYMELFDPPLLGGRLTSYKADGSAMSRSDRFLLSIEWIEEWKVEGQWALNRDVSDHCPIMLKLGKQEWGPKPFRFNNCWLAHPGLNEVVEKC